MSHCSPQLSRHRAQNEGQQAGFTMMELIVVAAVAALLAAVAVPSMRSFVRSITLSSTANDMLASLFLARSEAVKRRARVVVCKSDDGQTCTSSGGWEQGWIIFHDVNNDSSRQSTEAVLSVRERLPQAMRLYGNLHVARYVSYAPTGATLTSAGAFQSGTLTICEQSTTTSHAREIVISAGGRPRVKKTTLGACP
jgi:type IV fimbrial biogenesis protein FimT